MSNYFIYVWWCSHNKYFCFFTNTYPNMTIFDIYYKRDLIFYIANTGVYESMRIWRKLLLCWKWWDSYIDPIDLHLNTAILQIMLEKIQLQKSQDMHKFPTRSKINKQNIIHFINLKINCCYFLLQCCWINSQTTKKISFKL